MFRSTKELSEDTHSRAFSRKIFSRLYRVESSFFVFTTFNRHHQISNRTPRVYDIRSGRVMYLRHTLWAIRYGSSPGARPLAVRTELTKQYFRAKNASSTARFWYGRWPIIRCSLINYYFSVNSLARSIYFSLYLL